MTNNPNSRTTQVLNIMLVLTWVAFIGLLIKTGALLFTYTLSYFNPEVAGNLYRGFDLSHLRQKDFWMYTHSVSFLVAFSAMKAYIAYLIIQVLSKVNLANPFTTEVAAKLESISYVLFGTWVVAIINNEYSHWLIKRAEEMHREVDSGEFIFMAGLVYIISQVFKRGVELQAENDLTV